MAEEQETEIVIEEKETEPESTEVSVPEVSEEKPVEEESSSNEDELESYSKGVQSRINKLTAKARQEERDKEEAVRVSQRLLEENKRLTARVSNLDTGFLNEYGNRLDSQSVTAKQMMKQAYESGDSDKIVEAQELISKLAVDRQRYEAAKTKVAKPQQAAPTTPVPTPAAPPPQQAAPDPKSEEWASRNTWFGQDEIMTQAAFVIDRQVKQEGFDPTADDYYSEIDSRLRNEFPHKFQTVKKTGGAQVAPAAASASRNVKSGRRSVKLTHSQVAIAKKLGVPLEEYAKYVKE